MWRDFYRCPSASVTLDPTMSSMTSQLITALALFGFTSSITPGPNNTMLLGSGANFGLRASVPHMLGVLGGFLLLLAAVGLGLGAAFKAYPVLHTVLAWAGTIYLLYLAARIAFSTGLKERRDGARPMRFWEAVTFQAVNPKAWAMALGAMTAYAPAQDYMLNVLVVIAVFGVVNAPCIVAWTAFGVGMRRFLDRPAVLRGFNVAMAMALVASLVPTIVELVRGSGA
jgi:threonine/homoserine/homoserine lactone efflux protein